MKNSYCDILSSIFFILIEAYILIEFNFETNPKYHFSFLHFISVQTKGNTM